MPCVAYLYLGVRLRKCLRRRIGRKAGNVVGKFVLVFGGPPLLFAGVILLLLRLALNLLSKLETARTVRG
jgi:hypothetical protein